MSEHSPLLPSLALLATGCSVVRPDTPIGATPVELDPDEWNGTWTCLNDAG